MCLYWGSNPVVVERLYIESAMLLGNEHSSFRKYNSRRTLRGAALIDKFSPRGSSEAEFVDAEKINGPILGHSCEMA